MMVLLAIFFTICILLLLFYSLEIGKDNEDRVLMLLRLFTCLLAVPLLVILWAHFAGEKEEVVVHEIELAALKDENVLKGSFFLGSGSIGEELYYYYYGKCGDRCYKFDKIRAKDVLVFEDATDRPVIQWKEEKLSGKTCFLAGVCDGERLPTEIHIPEGSILFDFEINLQ